MAAAWSVGVFISMLVDRLIQLRNTLFLSNQAEAVIVDWLNEIGEYFLLLQH